jgi:hypothetical protein
MIETIFTISKKNDDTRFFMNNDMCLFADLFKFIWMTKLRLQFIVLLSRFLFFIKEIFSTNIEWLWISIDINSNLQFKTTNIINEIFLRYYKSYCSWFFIYTYFCYWSCFLFIYISVFTRRYRSKYWSKFLKWQCCINFISSN